MKHNFYCKKNFLIQNLIAQKHCDTLNRQQFFSIWWNYAFCYQSSIQWWWLIIICKCLFSMLKTNIIIIICNNNNINKMKKNNKNKVKEKKKHKHEIPRSDHHQHHQISSIELSICRFVNFYLYTHSMYSVEDNFFTLKTTT